MVQYLKEIPHKTAARLTVPFPPAASCQFLDLGTVHKLFVQDAQNECVSARRRREACRGTLTDDNAAMADSDKHNVWYLFSSVVINGDLSNEK